MSTFNGIVHEFPEIAIDYFLLHKDRSPPRACFLSHVHSDHLTGLETESQPLCFIYCSAATRELLLKLERRMCRINYAQGLLEAPMQTYNRESLRRRLKPLPLDTPTEVELEPGNVIQVTLLDANHCPGAVMFLIEGDGKAVLYTGDIRAEPWWVNSIARNPCMIEYSTGLKTLDRIYLDTSILRDYKLQTKAEGLRELIDKVIQYPEDTIFFLHTWTYGYEEVWVALSKALKSKIHVDKYKMRIYKSLAVRPTKGPHDPQFHLTKETPYLAGFTRGNEQVKGQLTSEENVRIHSCEKGTECSVMKNKPVVMITPIVAHLPDGQDVEEVGIGGGLNDLNPDQTDLTREHISALIDFITSDTSIDAESRLLVTEKLRKRLRELASTGGNVSLDLDIAEFDHDAETNLTEAIGFLFKDPASAATDEVPSLTTPLSTIPSSSEAPVKLHPNRIRFSYARHSALPELTHFVGTFKPKDIWPCTVDELSWYQSGITMKKLFGKYCSGHVFEHDSVMASMFTMYEEQLQEKQHDKQMEDADMTDSEVTDSPRASGNSSQPMPIDSPIARRVRKRDSESFGEDPQLDYDMIDELELQGGSQSSTLSALSYETRLGAYRAAKENMKGETWQTLGLISTTDHHTVEEEELGTKR